MARFHRFENFPKSAIFIIMVNFGSFPKFPFLDKKIFSMHFHNNRGLAGFKKPEYKNQDNSSCKTEILFLLFFYIFFRF